MKPLKVIAVLLLLNSCTKEDAIENHNPQGGQEPEQKVMWFDDHKAIDAFIDRTTGGGRTRQTVGAVKSFENYCIHTPKYILLSFFVGCKLRAKICIWRTSTRKTIWC